MRLRALTVRQPWAWAIAEAGKSVENRSRPLQYRGPLAIHAGLSIDRDAYRAPAIMTASAAFQQRMGRPPVLATGAVIAVVDLVGCHGDSRCCLPWGQPWQHHLQLANVRVLRSPVPVRGQMGLWFLDEAATAEVRRQVPVPL